MSHGAENINLVIQAAIKLDTRSEHWRNLISFAQSCYGCRVKEYDLADAEATLARLTEEEAHALIVWVLQVEEIREDMRKKV